MDEPNNQGSKTTEGYPESGAQARPSTKDAQRDVPPPRQAYVRPRTPHKTQSAINDLNQDEGCGTGYAHDSNISVRGKAFSGRGYRRSRSAIGQVQSGRYGQYLEIPKGRRSIFSSREQAKRRRSTLGLVAVIVVLAAVALVIWQLISRL